MNRTTKRVFSVLLTLVMVLSLLPATALAASKPTITSHPKNVTTTVDGKATFTVNATGATSYQWQYRTSSGGTWASAGGSGNKTATMTFNPATIDRAGYQYRCAVTNSAGTVYSNAAYLYIKPSITTQPSSKTVAPTDSVTFTVKAAGRNLSYQWQFKEAGDSTWYNNSCTSATFTIDEVGSWRNGYQYRCIVKNGVGSATSNAATLTVKAADTKPVITSQPKSVTTTADGKATFTVAASGTGLTYQWQFKEAGDSTWYNNSCTSATFSINAPQTWRNGYQYRCAVKNAAGTTYSNIVTLTVEKPLTIQTQPVNEKKCVAEIASFTVVPTGGTAPYTYEWQYSMTDEDAASGRTAFEPADWVEYDMATLTFEVDLADFLEEIRYRCVITDAKGATVTSNEVWVEPPALTITTQPQHAIVDGVGLPATFTVAAEGGLGDLSYQWYVKANEAAGIAEDTALSDETNTVLRRIVTQNILDYGYTYYCIITDVLGESVKTNEVGVAKKLAITTQPTNVETTIGSIAEFNVAVTGGAELAYQWQYSTDGTTFVDITSESDMGSGYNGSCFAFAVDADYPESGYLFRCVITSSDGQTVTTDTVKVIFPMSISVQPVSRTAKVGDTSVTYTVTVVNGSGDYSYQWQYKYGENDWSLANSTSTPNLLGYKGATLGVKNITEDSFNYQYRCVITDNVTETDLLSAAVSLTEDPNLYIAVQPQVAQSLVGSTAIFSLTPRSGTAPYTYAWYQKGDEAAGTPDIRLSKSKVITALNVTVTEDIISSQQRYYCVVTDDNGGSVTSEEVWVEDMPVTITTQPTAQTTSGGKATFSVAVQGGTAPYTYQWRYRASLQATESLVTEDMATGVGTNSITVTFKESDFNYGMVYFLSCWVYDAEDNVAKSEAVKLTWGS